MAAFFSILVIFTISDLIDLIKMKSMSDYIVYFVLMITAAVCGALYFYNIGADSFTTYLLKAVNQ